MAEQASLVQEGVDRLSDAFQSIDHEFQRVQKRLNTRRRLLEKRLTSTCKNVEERTRTELDRFQLEIKKLPLVRRVDALRIDLTKQFGSGIRSLLGLTQIPSHSDIARIDKRLSALSRRVKGIEKARKANGASPA